MAGLSGFAFDALVQAIPFAEGVPLAVAASDQKGSIQNLVRGRWPDGGAVTSADQFYAASLAKQVTGAAVALLVNRGLLAPSDRLIQFMPDLPAWMGEVTLLQLLGHLAGLPSAGVLENRPVDFAWTNAGVIAALHSMPVPADAPGTRFDYSNAGYVILADIVVQASRRDFASFVQDEVFAPLGVVGASFPRSEDVLKFQQIAGMGRLLPLSQGDGGLWTTAQGFVRWLDGQNRDVLDIADRVEAPISADYGWGIGLRVHRGQPLFIHGGSWRGACCKAVRSRALGVSVAAFAADEAERDHIGVLVDAILAAYS